MRHSFILAVVMAVGLSLGEENGPSPQVEDAPADVVAALVLKVAAYERNISGSEKDVSVYVMASGEVAEELRRGIGKSIGNSTLNAVEEGEGMPATKPSILYIGSETKIAEVLEYTRSNKILSVTGKPDLVAKGVTLGIGIGDDGRPEIIINLSSSVEEGLDWNAAIMRVAKTIK